jgi:hypothetical protein
MQLSFDPNGTHIVLIGNTTCVHDTENLPDLPSVKNNVEALQRIFEAENIVGLDSACIETILDPQSSSQLLTRLSKTARKTTDTLLVYYAGHGIKSASLDGLFLATVETTQEDCHLNGAEFNRIRQIIYDSPAAKKILIFDCCYSGEITKDEMGGAPLSVVANSIQIKGTYSIASAPRNSLAYASPHDKYTAFSNELIHVLEDGIEDNVEFLTLDKVYEAVKSRVATNPKLPPPQRKVALDVNEFVIARNLGWAPNPEVRIRQIEERYKSQLQEADHKQRVAADRIAELETKLDKARPGESGDVGNAAIYPWQALLFLILPVAGSVFAMNTANSMWASLPPGPDRKAYNAMLLVGSILVASTLIPVCAFLVTKLKHWWPRLIVAVYAPLLIIWFVAAVRQY